MTKVGSLHPVAQASVKSDWQTAVIDSNATAETSSLTEPTAASANVRPLRIPETATRILLRQRVSQTGVTVGTLAVCQVWVVDQQGVPTRIDNATQTATGLTIALNGTLTNNVRGGSVSGLTFTFGQGGTSADYRYGDVNSLTGIDCLGGSYLYVLPSTASAHTGGAASPTIEVLFLN